jgi:hypothetical protein
MNDHVLATFTRRADAEVAVERTRAAFPGVAARIGDTDDELDALALGQRAEMDDSMSAIPAGFMSGPMARGALVWGLVGLAARQAVKEGETVTEDPTAVVRADCPREQAGEIVELLIEQGARSARFVDAPVSRRPTSEVEAPRSPHDDPAAHHGDGSDSDAGFRSDVP